MVIHSLSTTPQGDGRTTGCQAKYFRIFRIGPAFSYSPEKGLNHNGFVKICRYDMAPRGA